MSTLISSASSRFATLPKLRAVPYFRYIYLSVVIFIEGGFSASSIKLRLVASPRGNETAREIWTRVAPLEVPPCDRRGVTRISTVEEIRTCRPWRTCLCFDSTGVDDRQIANESKRVPPWPRRCDKYLLSSNGEIKCGNARERDKLTIHEFKREFVLKLIREELMHFPNSYIANPSNLLQLFCIKYS